MRFRRGACFTVSPGGDELTNAPPTALTLIDAVSNDRGAWSTFDDWAWLGAAFTRPTKMGVATARVTAVANISCPPRVSLGLMRVVMIASMRLWRFAPLTPAAQTSGDSR